MFAAGARRKSRATPSRSSRKTATAAPAAEAPPDWGTVLPTADVAAGEAVFAKCKSCHTIDAGGANGTGPNLYGVVGRKPGSARAASPIRRP